MDYIVEIVLFIAPLLTVPVQSQLIGFIIDTFGWRSGCWNIGKRCIKKGNIVAFGVALFSALFVACADFIISGDILTPETLTANLGVIWFATWKYYSDSKTTGGGEDAPMD